VTAGGGSITGATAVTNASGVATVGSWTLGPVAGPNTLTATVAGTGVVNNPIVFRGVGCQGGGGTGYGVTLCFTTAMSATQRAVFETAAARWASLITGDVEDVDAQIPAETCGGKSPSLDLIIDDLVIFAGVEEIDGPGQVLGSAGPCYIRDDANALPVVGVMRFDLSDVNALEAGGQLGAVIVHEMGHVLGIGSLWSFRGLLHNPSPAAGPPVDTYFGGANGIAGFDAIGGTTYTGGIKVPVENTGGSGTANAHWRENVLKNELMTGYLNNGSNPLSQLTVRSLQDLGYAVNVGGADAFFLTLTLRAQKSGSEPTGLHLGNDSWNGPRWSITRRGRRTLLHP
jgi:Leishmanolysin